MIHLLVTLSLAASGDYLVLQTCRDKVLAPAQKTTLGGIVSNTHAGVTISAVNDLRLRKRPGGVELNAIADEALTQAAAIAIVDAQLAAGSTYVALTPGFVGGSRQRTTGFAPLSGADVTALSTLLGALCPSAVNLQDATFTQSGTTVTLQQLTWAQVMTKPQWFAALSAVVAGPGLLTRFVPVVIGVVP